MSKLIKSLESFSFDKNRNKTFPVKGAVIIGYHKDGTATRLAHISKPKHVTEKEFEEILDHLQIGIQTRIA